MNYAGARDKSWKVSRKVNKPGIRVRSYVVNPNCGWLRGNCECQDLFSIEHEEQVMRMDVRKGIYIEKRNKRPIQAANLKLDPRIKQM